MKQHVFDYLLVAIGVGLICLGVHNRSEWVGRGSPRHVFNSCGSTVYWDFWTTQQFYVSYSVSNLTGVGTDWGYYSAALFGETPRLHVVTNSFR